MTNSVRVMLHLSASSTRFLDNKNEKLINWKVRQTGKQISKDFFLCPNTPISPSNASLDIAVKELNR